MFIMEKPGKIKRIYIFLDTKISVDKTVFLLNIWFESKLSNVIFKGIFRYHRALQLKKFTL